jgi:hypothetical protein
MKLRTVGGSIWLVTVAAATVLLIGAFGHFASSNGESGGTQTNAPAPVVSTTTTPAPEPPAWSAVAPTLPADLSPGIAEVIRLAESHIPDETILAFVQNSGQPYRPTGEEVLYLSDLGVSDKVIGALFKKPDMTAAAPATPAPPAEATAPEPPPAPAAPAATAAAAPDGMIEPPPAAMAEAEPPPLQNPQESYFYDSLAPYGSWVQLADGSWCWQPMVSSVNADWLPYCDRGHWVLTDEGWYWASDYSWGWAAFHYGRWSHDGRFGWVWSPGTVWAPAWVAWRNTDTHSGWAPLPPGAHFSPRFGLFAGPGLAGFNASFGVSASWFTFVPNEHFLSRKVSSFAAPASGLAALFQSSTPVNNYSVAGRKILHLGVSAEKIAAVTQTPLRKFTLQEASSPDAGGGRIGGEGLAVFRPKVSAPAVPAPANGPAQPVLINKATRAAATDGDMGRAFAPRPGALAPEASGEAQARWSQAPARPGFITGNFQPSAKRINPPTAFSEPLAGRPASPGMLDLRRTSQASEWRPAQNAQALHSERAYNSAPSAAPEHIAPPSAPTESRGGGAEAGRGAAAAASSTTSSSSSSKTLK